MIDKEYERIFNRGYNAGHADGAASARQSLVDMSRQLDYAQGARKAAEEHQRKFAEVVRWYTKLTIAERPKELRKTLSREKAVYVSWVCESCGSAYGDAHDSTCIHR